MAAATFDLAVDRVILTSSCNKGAFIICLGLQRW